MDDRLVLNVRFRFDRLRKYEQETSATLEARSAEVDAAFNPYWGPRWGGLRYGYNPFGYYGYDPYYPYGGYGYYGYGYYGYHSYTSAYFDRYHRRDSDSSQNSA